MDWNYYNTFITVSPDCPAEYDTVPPDKKIGRTKPSLEYELASLPYSYTQEELLYEVHVGVTLPFRENCTLSIILKTKKLGRSWIYPLMATVLIALVSGKVM